MKNAPTRLQLHIPARPVLQNSCHQAVHSKTAQRSAKIENSLKRDAKVVTGCCLMSRINVKNKDTTDDSLRTGSQCLRVFYLPFYVPVEVIVQQLALSDMKVLKTFQRDWSDVQRLESYRRGLRT